MGGSRTVIIVQPHGGIEFFRATKFTKSMGSLTPENLLGHSLRNITRDQMGCVDNCTWFRAQPEPYQENPKAFAMHMALGFSAVPLFSFCGPVLITGGRTDKGAVAFLSVAQTRTAIRAARLFDIQHRSAYADLLRWTDAFHASPEKVQIRMDTCLFNCIFPEHDHVHIRGNAAVVQDISPSTFMAPPYAAIFKNIVHAIENNLSQVQQNPPMISVLESPQTWKCGTRSGTISHAILVGNILQLQGEFRSWH